MELTREIIESIARNGECEVCGNKTSEGDLARMLLAEMEKPDLWKDAPCDACHMVGVFADRNENKVGEFSYHRSPLKSRIDEIAESKALLWSGCNKVNGIDLVDIIKSAILQDREEREER